MRTSTNEEARGAFGKTIRTESHRSIASRCKISHIGTTRGFVHRFVCRVYVASECKITTSPSFMHGKKTTKQTFVAVYDDKVRGKFALSAAEAAALWLVGLPSLHMECVLCVALNCINKAQGRHKSSASLSSNAHTVVA